MRKFLMLFLLTALVLFTTNARSADDGLTVTGEKGLVTVFTADTVPDGKFSFGVNAHNVDRDLLDVDIAYYSVTFGYGITDNLEFVVAVQPYIGYDIDQTNPSGDEVTVGTVNGMLVPDTASYRDGFGDLTVGAKYVFVRGDNYGVGLRGFVKIPTANEEEGIGTGKPDFGVDFIVSGTAGALGVAGNIGVELTGDPDFRQPDGTEDPSGVEVNPGHRFRWGVGANFPADSSVQGIVELTGFSSFDNDQDASLLARYPGAAFEFDDAVDLGGGLRFRFGSSWYLTAVGRWNLQAERDRAQYPYGGSVQLAYAPGRAALGEAVPPPPPPPAPPPAPAPPAPAPAPPPEFVWPEVYFPFDQYILTGETRTKLDSVAGYMTDHPNVNVTIEGHCCYIGTDEYNLALGQHRADAIKDYLGGKGISASRLRTVSYGESRPKYDNSKEITRRFNRRGFFVVIRPE